MISLKKKIYSLFFIFILVILASCSAAGGSPNYSPGMDESSGIPFYQYKTFMYNDQKYSIYRLESIEFIDESIQQGASTLKYFYKKYSKMETSEWVINYYQDTLYTISNDTTDKELIETFYTNVKSSLIEYEEVLGIKFETLEKEEDFEKEFIVDMEKEFSDILVVDLYLPYKLKNETTGESYFINIPIKSFIAYKNNDILTINVDSLTLTVSYTKFIQLNNVKES